MTKSDLIKKLRKLYIEKTNKYGYVDITDQAMSEIIDELQDLLLPLDPEVIQNEEN